MKSHIFFGAVFVLFFIEVTVFILYILPKTENEQDTVAVNEVVQTVQDNWKHLDSLTNPTALDYVVIDLEGTVLYKTKSGLSENLNMAIRHKDTILDVRANGAAGKQQRQADLPIRKTDRHFRLYSGHILTVCYLCGFLFLYAARDYPTVS